MKGLNRVRVWLSASILVFVALAGFSAVSAESIDRNNLVCDLDGDGVDEDIEFFMEAKHSKYTDVFDDFTIVVNGDSTSHYADALTGVFRSVDIDSLDNFKELSVSEYGPSDDPAVYFFRYIDGELIELGKLPGRLESGGPSMIVDGSGEVRARCRGQLLHTWFHACKFRVNENNRLDLVREGFYPMGAKLELREELSLVTEPGGKNLSTVLAPGAWITVVGSDDVRWCLAKTDDNVRGWFEMSDFNTLADGRKVHAVFQGLCLAD